MVLIAVFLYFFGGARFWSGFDYYVEKDKNKEVYQCKEMTSYVKENTRVREDFFDFVYKTDHSFNSCESEIIEYVAKECTKRISSSIESMKESSGSNHPLFKSVDISMGTANWFTAKEYKLCKPEIEQGLLNSGFGQPRMARDGNGVWLLDHQALIDPLSITKLTEPQMDSFQTVYYFSFKIDDITLEYYYTDQQMAWDDYNLLSAN